jgi:hypothetical protein
VIVPTETSILLGRSTVLEVSFMIRDSDKGAQFVLERKRWQWKTSLTVPETEVAVGNHFGADLPSSSRIPCLHLLSFPAWWREFVASIPHK